MEFAQPCSIVTSSFAEVSMSRRIRALLPLLLLTFALSAAACADSTAPRADTPCDTTNNNTCK